MSAIPLTDRQREVAALIAQGRTAKQIAHALAISPRRVQCLIATIGRRIGAAPQGDTRIQIAQWWSRAA